MGLLEVAQTVYPKISIVSIPLLFIAVFPHILPTAASGIAPHHKLSAPTISLTFWTIARAGTTVLDHLLIQKGITEEASTSSSGAELGLLCGVDAIVVTALITGMAGHLPVIALHRYQTLPTPKRPVPTRPNTLRTALVLMLVYAYALLPSIPTLAGAVASHEFDSLPGDDSSGSGTMGFGIWWGFYCVEPAGWFRIVRPLSILLPIVATLPIIVLMISSLYSTSGHPSPHIHPTSRNWAQAVFMMLSSVMIIGYMVLERVTGWFAEWWPRSLEALAGPLLLICLITDPRVYNAYVFWIRFKRPPPPLLPPSSPIDPFLLSSPKSSKGPDPSGDPDRSPTESRASSFLVPPPTAHRRGVHFPPTPQRNTIIPYHPSILSNLSNTTSVMTERMEELLPPLRKKEEMTGQDRLELERQLHPHPHSINDDCSPPTELFAEDGRPLSSSHTQAPAVAALPPLSSFAPTPTSQQGSEDGRRYTSSTTSSPFAYEAFATMYSSHRPLSSSDSMNSAPFPYATSTVYTDRTPLPTALPVSQIDGSRDTYDSLRITGIGPMRADRRSVVPTVRVIDTDTGNHEVGDLTHNQIQRRDSRSRLPFRSSTLDNVRVGQERGPAVDQNERSSSGSGIVQFPRPRIRASTVDDLSRQRSFDRVLAASSRPSGSQAQGRPLTEVSSIYSQPSLIEAITNTETNANLNSSFSRSTPRQSLRRAPSPTSSISISNYSYPNPNKHLVRTNSDRSSTISGNAQNQLQLRMRTQRPAMPGHMRTDSTLSGPSEYNDSNHPLESLAEDDAEEEEAGRIVFGPRSISRSSSSGQQYGGHDYDYMEEIEGDPVHSVRYSSFIQ
ncbi:hypothetical protein IAU59_000241 [Kwoniella sp. CBS 9459]